MASAWPKKAAMPAWASWGAAYLTVTGFLSPAPRATLCGSTDQPAARATWGTSSSKNSPAEAPLVLLRRLPTSNTMVAVSPRYRCPFSFITRRLVGGGDGAIWTTPSGGTGSIWEGGPKPEPCIAAAAEAGLLAEAGPPPLLGVFEPPFEAPAPAAAPVEAADAAAAAACCCCCCVTSTSWARVASCRSMKGSSWGCGYSGPET
mmetsp:Transcript_26293/g.71121  ORF Transcript_26293/g.71121 Transcript_26293/m.71121 type:complete len:204 (+) Transcript_26293:233-844(+)